MKSSLLLPLLAGALAVAAHLNPAPAATETVRLRIEPDRGVLPADAPGKAIIKIGLDCAKPPRSSDRPPVNLALVIDRSGSMHGDKIVRAREAALELVRRLDPHDRLSLVAYDTRPEVLVPSRPVGDGRHFESIIRGLEPGGNTALHGGVVAGAAEIRRHIETPGFTHRLILLSDGLANVGPSTPDQLGQLGASLMREGISVTTIGLGLGFNEDLMTQLAFRSDGNTYFVENSADLPRIFAAELGDVLSVVARQVRIEIELPEHVRPLRFIGRDGTIRGRHATLELNQLYGGQEKFALLEIEVTPGRPGTEQEIARATLAYEDAFRRQSATASARSAVKFSTDRAAVVSSANHQVQADYAANAVALAKDQAVALVDAGRPEAAAEVLRRESDELESLAKEYHNAAVATTATSVKPAAASISRQGLSNAERKAFRNDSTQVKSQQAKPAKP